MKCFKAGENLEIDQKTALRGIGINQYTLKGKYIKTWKTMQEAATELKLHKSGISFVCNLNRKTHGGFIWRFNNQD